jgi:hypothetical protein
MTNLTPRIALSLAAHVAFALPAVTGYPRIFYITPALILHSLGAS